MTDQQSAATPIVASKQGFGDGELVETGVWCLQHRRPLLRFPYGGPASMPEAGICFACCIGKAFAMPSETRQYYADLLRRGMGAGGFAELISSVETSNPAVTEDDRTIIGICIHSAINGIGLERTVAQLLVNDAEFRGFRD